MVAVIFRGWNLSLWLLLFILLISFSCAVNPVTGKREIMLFSESSEIQLGEQTDREIRTQFGVYDDSALNDYLNQIGQRLVPHTHRPHLQYHFAILDTPLINAFAVPGGYIYVTRGLLAALNSEGELALVLGHELGHVNARHSVKKLSRLLLVQIGLALGSALSETVAKISGLASVGIQLLFLKYSRDDEREADRLAVLYSRRAGYNPASLINFFATLQKLGDLSGGHQLPGFLSTHPLTSERIRNTRSLLQSEDSRLKVARITYLRRLNQLIFDQDPRQGFVEGQTFYHPRLGFQLNFPRGWKSTNQPSRLTLISSDKKAVLLVEGEPSNEPLGDYAEKKAAQWERGEILSRGQETINHFQAFQQTIRIPQEESGAIILKQSFLRQKKYIFTISTAAEEDDYFGYENEFNSIKSSFRPLTNPRYLHPQPYRLYLVKANGRDTLQEIFKKEKTPQKFWKKLAIMNGRRLEDKPPANSLVKIARK
ncbi:MAG: M48 family metalloprotease [Candidatus Aminicenantes bacterium]|nr:M48 family metalloprotease [Candidatus Aminicenantes bacterium]